MDLVSTICVELSRIRLQAGFSLTLNRADCPRSGWVLLRGHAVNPSVDAQEPPSGRLTVRATAPTHFGGRGFICFRFLMAGYSCDLINSFLLILMEK